MAEREDVSRRGFLRGALIAWRRGGDLPGGRVRAGRPPRADDLRHPRTLIPGRFAASPPPTSP